MEDGSQRSCCFVQGVVVVVEQRTTDKKKATQKMSVTSSYQNPTLAGSQVSWFSSDQTTQNFLFASMGDAHINGPVPKPRTLLAQIFCTLL